jgi:hypothetical protein
VSVAILGRIDGCLTARAFHTWNSVMSVIDSDDAEERRAGLGLALAALSDSPAVLVGLLTGIQAALEVSPVDA